MKAKAAELTGFVLAGGKSSRMGRDKGLIELNGKPLVSIAAEKLAQICHRVVILANSDSYESYGYELIPDAIENLGPIGGLLSGLSNSTTNLNLFLACDLPLVPLAIYEQLETAMGNDFEICVPKDQSGIHPLCGLYKKSVLAKIEERVAKKQNGILKLLDYCDSLVVPINDNFKGISGSVFINVNTPEDLKRVNK